MGNAENLEFLASARIGDGFDLLCDFSFHSRDIFDCVLKNYPGKIVGNQIDSNGMAFYGLWLSELIPFFRDNAEEIDGKSKYSVLTARQSLIYEVDGDMISFST